MVTFSRGLAVPLQLKKPHEQRVPGICSHQAALWTRACRLSWLGGASGAEVLHKALFFFGNAISLV